MNELNLLLKEIKQEKKFYDIQLLKNEPITNDEQINVFFEDKKIKMFSNQENIYFDENEEFEKEIKEEKDRSDFVLPLNNGKLYSILDIESDQYSIKDFSPNRKYNITKQPIYSVEKDRDNKKTKLSSSTQLIIQLDLNNLLSLSSIEELNEKIKKLASKQNKDYMINLQKKRTEEKEKFEKTYNEFCLRFEDVQGIIGLQTTVEGEISLSFEIRKMIYFFLEEMKISTEAKYFILFLDDCLVMDDLSEFGFPINNIIRIPGMFSVQLDDKQFFSQTFLTPDFHPMYHHKKSFLYRTKKLLKSFQMTNFDEVFGISSSNFVINLFYYKLRVYINDLLNNYLPYSSYDTFYPSDFYFFGSSGINIDIEPITKEKINMDPITMEPYKLKYSCTVVFSESEKEYVYGTIQYRSKKSIFNTINHDIYERLQSKMENKGFVGKGVSFIHQKLIDTKYHGKQNLYYFNINDPFLLKDSFVVYPVRASIIPVLSQQLDRESFYNVFIRETLAHLKIPLPPSKTSTCNVSIPIYLSFDIEPISSRSPTQIMTQQSSDMDTNLFSNLSPNLDQNLNKITNSNVNKTGYEGLNLSLYRNSNSLQFVDGLSGLYGSAYPTTKVWRHINDPYDRQIFPPTSSDENFRGFRVADSTQETLINIIVNQVSRWNIFT